MIESTKIEMRCEEKIDKGLVTLSLAYLLLGFTIGVATGIFI